MKNKIYSRFEKYLGEVVLGAIDGIVTTFAIVSATVGAGLGSGIVIILGMANLIADGISMAVSAYLSDKSEREVDENNNRTIHQDKIALRVGLATFGAFIVVGFIPLTIYIADYVFRLNLHNLFLISSILAGLAFSGVGLLKGVVANRSKLRSVIETLALGAAASIAAYLVGNWLEQIVN
jgi:VIT1/CCC1 family predicted Fe2+/Mn2+ transporter